MQYTTQHHLKSVANGIPVIIAPLFLYSDDTSGNKSKQWNKFDLWCCSLACLPKHEVRHFTNIHLICCSNRHSAVDMSGPIVEDLLMLEEGMIIYDSFMKTDVYVIAPVICFFVTMLELLK